MEFQIPSSLKTEHEELHEELSKATKLGGKIGNAAKKVAKILHPHFIREEEFAMLQLGLLASLAEDTILPEMRDVIEMTDRLKVELPRMLEEHQEIVAALDEMATAMQEEDAGDVASFPEKLKLHAQTEEQVLYPASILVGEYLKLKL